MNSLISFIMGLMVSVYPFENSTQETVEEAQDRYQSIAQDLVDVVYDSNEDPLFSGEYGRLKTAMTLLSIASFESGFRRDVDFGELRGDKGASVCLMQINVGQTDQEGRSYKRFILDSSGYYNVVFDRTQGWGSEDLLDDRQKCFRVALAIARKSFAKCHESDDLNKLKLYTSGSCYFGSISSRQRMSRAFNWFSNISNDITFSDDQVLSYFQLD